MPPKRNFIFFGGFSFLFRELVLSLYHRSHTKKNYHENRCQHTLLFSFAYDALRHICKHLHPKCKLWGFREHKPYYVCRLHCFGVNFVPHLFVYRYKRKRRPDVLTLDAPERNIFIFFGGFSLWFQKLVLSLYQVTRDPLSEIKSVGIIQPYP